MIFSRNQPSISFGRHHIQCFSPTSHSVLLITILRYHTQCFVCLVCGQFIDGKYKAGVEGFRCRSCDKAGPAIAETERKEREEAEAPIVEPEFESKVREEAEAAIVETEFERKEREEAAAAIAKAEREKREEEAARKKKQKLESHKRRIAARAQEAEYHRREAEKALSREKEE